MGTASVTLGIWTLFLESRYNTFSSPLHIACSIISLVNNFSKVIHTHVISPFQCVQYLFSNSFTFDVIQLVNTKKIYSFIQKLSKTYPLTSHFLTHSTYLFDFISVHSSATSDRNFAFNIALYFCSITGSVIMSTNMLTYCDCVYFLRGDFCEVFRCCRTNCSCNQ